MESPKKITLWECLEIFLTEAERLIAEKLGFSLEPKHQGWIEYEVSYRTTYLNPLREELLKRLHARVDPTKFINGMFATIKGRRFFLKLEGGPEDFNSRGVLSIFGLQSLKIFLSACLHNQEGFATDFMADIIEIEQAVGTWRGVQGGMPKDAALALKGKLSKSLIDPNSVIEFLKAEGAIDKTFGQYI